MEKKFETVVYTTSPSPSTSPLVRKGSPLRSPIVQCKKMLREKENEIRLLKEGLNAKEHQLDTLKQDIEEMTAKINILIKEKSNYQKLEAEIRRLTNENEKLKFSVSNYKDEIDEKENETEKLKKEVIRLQRLLENLEFVDQEKRKLATENESLQKLIDASDRKTAELNKKLKHCENLLLQKDEEIQSSFANSEATAKDLRSQLAKFRDENDQLQYLAEDANRARVAESQLRNQLSKKETEFGELETRLIEEQEKSKNLLSSLHIEKQNLLELTLLQKQQLDESINKSRNVEQQNDELTRIVENQRTELEKLCNIESENDSLQKSIDASDRKTVELNEKLERYENALVQKEEEIQTVLANNEATVNDLRAKVARFQDENDQLHYLAEEVDRARMAESQLRNQLSKKETDFCDLEKHLVEEQEKSKNAVSSFCIEKQNLLELTLLQKQQLDESINKCQNVEQQNEDLKRIVENQQKDLEKLRANESEKQNLLELALLQNQQLDEKHRNVEQQIYDLMCVVENQLVELEKSRTIESEKQTLLELTVLQKQQLEESMNKIQSVEQQMNDLNRVVENQRMELEQSRAIESEKQGLWELTVLQKQQLDEGVNKIQNFEQQINDLKLIVGNQQIELARSCAIESENEMLQKSIDISDRKTEDLNKKVKHCENLLLQKEEELQSSFANNEAIVKDLRSQLAKFRDENDRLQYLAEDANRARVAENQWRNQLSKRETEFCELETHLIEEQEKSKNALSSFCEEKQSLLELTVLQKQQLEESVNKSQSFEQQINDLKHIVENQQIELAKSCAIESEKQHLLELIVLQKQQLEESVNNSQKVEQEINDLKRTVEIQQTELAKSCAIESEKEHLLKLTVLQKQQLDESVNKSQNFEQQINDLKLIVENQQIELAKSSAIESEKQHLLELTGLQKQQLEERENKSQKSEQQINDLKRTVENQRKELEKSRVIESELKVYRDSQQQNRKFSFERCSSTETFQSVQSADAFFGNGAGDLPCEDEPVVMVQDSVTPINNFSSAASKEIAQKQTEVVVPQPNVDTSLSSAVFKRPKTPVAKLQFDCTSQLDDDVFVVPQSSTSRNRNQTPSVSSSSANSTPTNWGRRLTILNERNLQNLPHLRSFYPTETQQLPMEVQEEAVRNARNFQPPSSVEHLKSRENYHDKTDSKTLKKVKQDNEKSPFMDMFRKLKTPRSKPVIIDKSDIPENATVKANSLSFAIANSPVAERIKRKAVKNKENKEVKEPNTGGKKNKFFN